MGTRNRVASSPVKKNLRGVKGGRGLFRNINTAFRHLREEKKAHCQKKQRQKSRQEKTLKETKRFHVFGPPLGRKSLRGKSERGK